jgi:intraflagellar transport protein 122
VCCVGAAFVRSFVTFEHLPLVEFELDHAISDTEAMQLLEGPPPKGEGLRAVQRNKQVGNIQGTFREHSGSIQGTFREHSGGHVAAGGAAA